jgi:hypothetical protein
VLPWVMDAHLANVILIELAYLKNAVTLNWFNA